MARPQKTTRFVHGPTSNAEQPDAPGKPFPQRFTVVEHHPSGASTSGGSLTHAPRTGSTHTDTQRFADNSRRMEERAVQDRRDTLFWVSRLSDGPVDRALLRQAARSMKPNVYQDVMTERWVAELCAYPPCDKAPRKAYNAEQPMYRISLRAKRVFDTSAAMKYCSDECARRSVWYETVCLPQNAFEIPDLTQPVELLEDREGKTTTSSAGPSTSPSPAPEELPSLRQDRPSEGALSEPPRVGFASSAADQLADDFLSRLAIIEREPSSAPLPPSEEHADEINREDNPLHGERHQVSTSFDLDAVRRNLPNGETRSSSAPSAETTPNESSGGLSKRVEIDVDPEYRDLMDESWQLYQEMKAAGEFT